MSLPDTPSQDRPRSPQQVAGWRAGDAVTGPAADRVDDGDRIVWTIAFSPDGRCIAIGSGRRLQLWELAGRKLLWEETIAGPLGDVDVVAFSPDGSHVATGSGKRVQLWNVAGRSIVWAQTIAGRLGDVNAVAFSPDGRRLAAASDDILEATTQVWDTASGEELLIIEHDEATRSAAFSPEGRRIATGGDDGTARTWDAGAGSQLLVVDHTKAVNAVAYSPDGQRVATASDDTTARVWDATTGAELLHVRHGDAVTAVAFSPDGQRIATASHDGTARVWDAATGDQLLQVPHDGSVNAVAFSPDGRRLATASDDGAFIVDCRTGAPAGLWRDRPVHVLSDAPVARSGTDVDESHGSVELVLMWVLAAVLPWLLLVAWLAWEDTGAAYRDSSWAWWLLHPEAVPIPAMFAVAGAGGLLRLGAGPWRHAFTGLVAVLGAALVIAGNAAAALRVLERF